MAIRASRLKNRIGFRSILCQARPLARKEVATGWEDAFTDQVKTPSRWRDVSSLHATLRGYTIDRDGRLAQSFYGMVQLAGFSLCTSRRRGDGHRILASSAPQTLKWS
jgi:hypothetical protein